MIKLKHHHLVLLVLFISFSVSAQLLNIHPRTEEAKELAIEWLDLLESKSIKEAFDMLSPTFKSNLNFENWSKTNTVTRDKLGKLLERKFKRVVPYQDPPNSPLPGLYMAVEFDSVYEKASKHFQYIILHSQNNEPFKVMRHEVTMMSDD